MSQPAIVGLGYGSESLLAGGVPDIQLVVPAGEQQPLRAELDPDGRVAVRLGPSFRELGHQAGLPDVGFPDDDEFQAYSTS